MSKKTMLQILSSANLQSVELYLAKELGRDMIGVILNSGNNSDLYEKWILSSWTDLDNLLNLGSLGIFAADEKSTKPVLVKLSEELSLDDQAAKYLAELSQNISSKIYIHLDISTINAAAKKSIEKNNLNYLEVKSLTKSEKTKLLQEYLKSNYSAFQNQLTPATIDYLTEIELAGAMFNQVDFLVLSQEESWETFLNSMQIYEPNIFQISISKNLSKNQVKELLHHLSDPDKTQLIYTVIFSRLESKPELKVWLQNLIEADYMGKTKSNATLWAKRWLYAIIQNEK